MSWILLFLFTVTPIALALPFDVSGSNWYSEAASVFYEKGYFDAAASFRPGDTTLRSEFVELIVNLQGGVVDSDFSEAHFNDVPTTNPYFSHFEFAGEKGWITGEGNCYSSGSCNTNPSAPINRASAAALMIRAFDVAKTEHAPSFDDNIANQWFTEPITIAGSACILRGDSGSANVRPGNTINRAEMIVMLYRLHANLRYPNCSEDVSTTVIPTAPAIAIDHTVNTTSSNNAQEEVPNQTITGFDGPYSIFVTPDGIVYVTDSTQGKVYQFSEDFQSRFEVPISAAKLSFPHSVGFDKEGTMLIADHRKGEIARFAQDGSFIGYFDEGAFVGPVNTYTDHKDNIWISDYIGHRVVKYSPSGEFIGWLGHETINGFATSGESSASSNLGRFNQPHMVAVDSTDNIYVVDVSSHRIQRFNPDGTYKGWIGARAVGGFTNGWQTTGLSTPSKELGGFQRPTAVWVTGDDLIVTDTNNNRIVRYTTSGKLVGWMGAIEGGGKTNGWAKTGTAAVGSDIGEFSSPFMSQIHNGKLFIADTGNDRIQIIDLD